MPKPTTGVAELSLADKVQRLLDYKSLKYLDFHEKWGHATSTRSTELVVLRAAAEALRAADGMRKAMSAFFAVIDTYGSAHESEYGYLRAALAAFDAATGKP